MNRKPIICAALAACVLCSSAVIALNNTDHTAHAETVSFIYGDVDQDDTIDSSDALSVLRSIVDLQTLSELQRYIADVDSDGEITAGDALDILRYSSELETSFKTGKPDSSDTSHGSTSTATCNHANAYEETTSHRYSLTWHMCPECGAKNLAGIWEGKNNSWGIGCGF